MNAASAGLLVRDEQNSVNAVAAVINSARPIAALKRCPASSDVKAVNIAISNALSARIDSWNVVAPRNFPNTICVALTGELANRENRPACRSAAIRFIQIKGVASIITMLAGARNCTTR